MEAVASVASVKYQAWVNVKLALAVTTTDNKLPGKNVEPNYLLSTMSDSDSDSF